MENDVDKSHQIKWKEIVDWLFDKRVFNEKMTRDDLQAVEDLIAYYLQCEYNSARRYHEIQLSLTRK